MGLGGLAGGAGCRFGLGLVIDVAPVVSVELAWNATTGTGKNSGSVLANALTAGLRLRF
jgi:hypothetical protein